VLASVALIIAQTNAAAASRRSNFQFVSGSGKITEDTYDQVSAKSLGHLPTSNATALGAWNSLRGTLAHFHRSIAEMTKIGGRVVLIIISIVISNAVIRAQQANDFSALKQQLVPRQNGHETRGGGSNSVPAELASMRGHNIGAQSKVAAQ
jgi:hypothetical protein